MKNIHLDLDQKLLGQRKNVFLSGDRVELLESRPSGYACQPEIPFLRRDIIPVLAEMGIISGEEFPSDYKQFAFNDCDYEWAYNHAVPPLKLYLFSSNPEEQRQIVRDSSKLDFDNQHNIWEHNVTGLKETYLDTLLQIPPEKAKCSQKQVPLYVRTLLYFASSPKNINGIYVGKRASYDSLESVLIQLREKLFEITPIIPEHRTAPKLPLYSEGLVTAKKYIKFVELVPGRYIEHAWAMDHFIEYFQRLLKLDEFKKAVRAEYLLAEMQHYSVSAKKFCGIGAFYDSDKICAFDDPEDDGDSELFGDVSLFPQALSRTIEKLNRRSSQRLGAVASVIKKDASLSRLLQLIK